MRVGRRDRSFESISQIIVSKIALFCNSVVMIHVDGLRWVEFVADVANVDQGALSIFSGVRLHVREMRQRV